MAKYFYTVFFVVSLLLLVVLIRFFKKRISGYYTLLFCAVLASSFGYMQIAHATNLHTAVFANEVVYLGASFSPFFLTMCLADLCKEKVNAVTQGIFLAWGGLIFTLIGVTGIVPWYYETVSFVQVNGVGTLVKVYGPAHAVYILYLLVNTGICFYMIIHSFFRKKYIAYTTSILLLGCMLICLGTYIVERLTHLPITVVPFSYLLSQIGALLLLRKISMYDVGSLSTDFMVESITDGFVLCNAKGVFLGCDIAAKTWFPEVAELPIERKIKEKNTELLWNIGQWIEGKTEAEEIFIQQQDKVIAVRHAIISEKKSKELHCFYLRDDTKQQQYTKLMERYNEDLSANVEEMTAQLRQIQDDIIISMASIVENRDNNTGGHIARTSDVVKVFVRHLKREQIYPEISPVTYKLITKAAPLHDFGKIAIPDVILNKPGKFEPEEYEKMKLHPEKGAVIVEQILHNAQDPEFKKIAVNVAHYHHERWDGKGYPEGIQKEQIPFEARVMALADVFDALVSKRVYKEAFTYDEAFQIIAEARGTHFDPLLCREFLKCRAQLEKLYDSYEDD